MVDKFWELNYNNKVWIVERNICPSREKGKWIWEGSDVFANLNDALNYINNFDDSGNYRILERYNVVCTGIKNGRKVG